MGVKRFASASGTMYYPTSKKSKAQPLTKATITRIAKQQIAKSQEVKQISSSSISGPGSTGALVLMPLIAQGLDDGQRIGDSVRIKKIELRQFLSQSTAATAGDLFRTLIVYDKQANGAAPTFAQVITDNTAGGYLAIGTPNNVYISPGGMGTSRFKILYDKLNVFDQQVALAGTTSQISRENHIVLNKLNLPINYSGTGSTVASIASGSVYILTVGVNNTNVTSSVASWAIDYTDA